jgi:hypothetical protein
MNYDYKKLSKEKADLFRSGFISKYVDTSHELYKYIDGVSADETKNWDEGYIESHLWSCLKADCKRKTEFYSMMRELGKMEQKKVYVMWDVRPKKVIRPYEVKEYIPQYLSYFRTDDVIEIAPKELCEMLLREHHIEERAKLIGDVCTRFLPEDLYVFDESLSWFMALTHEEFTVNNEQRLCFSNLETVNEGVKVNLNDIIDDELFRKIVEFRNEDVDKIYNVIKIKNYSSDKSKTQTVEISGNKASLMRIAMEIVKIALYGNFNGCHSDLGNWFFDEYDGELTIKLEIP